MKNKKYILLTAVMAALSLTGCGEKLTQTADSIDVELGTDLQFNAADYFDADENVLNELVVDTSKVDTQTVGTGTITVAYKNDRYTITVNVKDTTAPVIKAKEELPAATVGDSINAANYIDIDDLSDCTAYFDVNGEPTETITYSDDLGEVQIFAKDSSDNQSESVTVDLSADAYPELAVKEPDVVYHEDNEAVNTYTYTDEWYNSFLEMTGDEFLNTSKTFINAVIQNTLDTRKGDRGIDVVNAYNEYKDILAEAIVWESMKEDARADNASDTAPAVNPVQSNTSNSSSSSSKNNNSSSNNSSSSVAPSSGDNFDNQGYQSREEQDQAMRDAAADAAASSGWNVSSPDIDPNNRDSYDGDMYLGEDGKLHFTD